MLESVILNLVVVLVVVFLFSLLGLIYCKRRRQVVARVAALVAVAGGHLGGHSGVYHIHGVDKLALRRGSIMFAAAADLQCAGC